MKSKPTTTPLPLGLSRKALSAAWSNRGSTAIDDAERELAATVPGDGQILTLEDARTATLAERPRFSAAFGAALRRAAQSVHRL